MNDTVAGVLGTAFLVGLAFAYVRQRGARKSIDGPAEVPTPAASEAAAAIAPGALQGSSSPNWGMPILYCALLGGFVSHRGGFWGHLWEALYLAALLFATYSTFSPRELAAEQLRRPGTTRWQHYATLGVPYVLFPLAGWVLAGPLRWGLGVFVPVVPWLLLLFAAAFARVKDR